VSSDGARGEMKQPLLGDVVGASVNGGGNEVGM
jgi:hypothetical protein